MNEHGKVNWESLLSQVETNLSDVLKTVRQREESFAEQVAVSESPDGAESVFRRLESFHECFAQLQTKAEQAQQVVTQLEQQWADGEEKIRIHLDRMDALAPKLRAWVKT